MIARLPATLLLATALTSCALGPRPTPSVPPVPAAAWNGTADAAAWPDSRWWQAFGSRELDQLVADVQAHNDDLAAAKARLEQADAQARIAGAPLLPSLSAAPIADETRRIAPNGVVRRYGTLNGVFSASYQLDVWGSNRDTARAAREDAQAVAFQLAVTRVTITASVASTYLRLLGTLDQIASANAQVENARAVLDGLKRQQQSGLIPGLQVEQQRALTDQLAADLPPLEAQRTHLLDALALLTGRNPEGFRISGTSLQEIRLPPIVAGVPSDLLVHRPDIQAAERDLAAAGGNVSAARKRFLPSFSLTATGGAGSILLGSAISGPTSIFDISLGVLQSIFDGGRLRGQLQDANGRYHELAATYLRSIHQAYGDVEDTLASAQAAREQVAREDAALASALRASNMARMAFAAGTTDMLPVLIAQQALATEEARAAQARLTQATSIVDLYTALGGGWSIAE
ncbi:efflux transporter outer membrane subunit [Sphingomonas sp. TDK1]|uniref:efflux transporter outer membrane subunit n=1 Tax=Sphingomonas sp. TDK1 TaxID=453247 RepID=UPI0007DA3533|nr:efflux transporter outer membrane subunit [Sphingomonas sp. TDK1]OAN57586.1 hypothetical protein A7X12_06870 [Sphingomonas sp. TDK1]